MNIEDDKEIGFPSFKEMLDFLIDSGYTDEKEIKSLKKKMKLKNKKK